MKLNRHSRGYFEHACFEASFHVSHFLDIKHRKGKDTKKKKKVIYYQLFKNIKTLGNITLNVVFELTTTASDIDFTSPLHDISNIRKHYRYLLDIPGSCNSSWYKESMNAKGSDITEILGQLVQFLPRKLSIIPLIFSRETLC